MGAKMKEGSKIKKENIEKNNFLEDLQRVQADFENYIKRVEKEKEQLKLHAKSELLLKFINIKEDFERILANVRDNGLEMVYNNLKKTLEEEGIKEIKSVGEKFDHSLHEAVKMIKGEENKVIEEVQKGYMFNDKILRVSKVVIGKGEEKPMEGIENDKNNLN